MLLRAIIKFFSQSFYFDKVAYYIAGSAVILYIFSFFIPVLFDAASMILLLLAIAILVDSALIFGKRHAFRGGSHYCGTMEQWGR